MLLHAALRILLMLALVVNGSGIALADVAPGTAPAAHAAQDLAPPCHESVEADALAGESAPLPHAPQPLDECAGTACRCVCLHGVTLPMLASLPAAPRPARGPAFSAPDGAYTAPALGHLIRPPIPAA